MALLRSHNPNSISKMSREMLISLVKKFGKMYSSIQLWTLVRVLNKTQLPFSNGISNLIEEVKFSGAITKSKVDRREIISLHEIWNQAAYEFTRGNFSKSLELRTHCLENIYALQGVNFNSGYYPPLINDGYFGAIGHLAFYFLHQECRGHELVDGPRFVLKPTIIANVPFSDFIRNDDVIIPAARSSLVNSLILTSLVENLEVVHTKSGFASIYTLAENHGIRQFERKKNRRLEFIDRARNRMPYYWEQASKTLKQLGMNPELPFVVLHVRGRNSYDLRGASVESFIPTVRYLLKQGFQVVRVGKRESKISELSDKGFFDLAGMDYSEYLLLYLLLNCHSLVGTQSGVAVTANMLSCPSLITNGIAIGRTTFTFPRTFYLPKILLMRGKETNFDNYFSPAVGFADATHGFLKRANLELRENTYHEVLRATEEFIHQSTVKECEISNWEPTRLDLKRRSLGALTLGRLSSEFIDRTNAS
jgi:putative glycosyltransferase (TIGR04372 family)